MRLSVELMQPILANAGVPMLFVQMPLLLISLPVIIAVEACLSRRWLTASWYQAWKWTSVANVVSTVIGFPLMWIAMLAIQMTVGGGSALKLSEPCFSVYTVTVQAAWLLPFQDRLYWMIPTAGMVLLIPAFFVTVAMERQIYKGVFAGNCGPKVVSRATWRMHLVSYGLLTVAGFCLLVSAIVSRSDEPEATANHRPTIQSIAPANLSATTASSRVLPSNFAGL